MFRFDQALKVYLHREAVDGRKNVNGLALLVEQEMKLDPFWAALFVFSNRRRDRVRILLWDLLRREWHQIRPPAVAESEWVKRIASGRHYPFHPDRTNAKPHDNRRALENRHIGMA